MAITARRVTIRLSYLPLVVAHRLIDRPSAVSLVRRNHAGRELAPAFTTRVNRLLWRHRARPSATLDKMRTELLSDQSYTAPPAQSSPQPLVPPIARAPTAALGSERWSTGYEHVRPLSSRSWHLGGEFLACSDRVHGRAMPVWAWHIPEWGDRIRSEVSRKPP